MPAASEVLPKVATVYQKQDCKQTFQEMNLTKSLSPKRHALQAIFFLGLLLNSLPSYLHSIDRYSKGNSFHNCLSLQNGMPVDA